MHTRQFYTLLLLLSFTFASAQVTKKYTTKRTTEPPRINGVFDDAIWKNVDWASDFTQYNPNNGAAPSQKTAFAIVYDDDNIYVAIKAYDTEPDKIDSRLTRRDGWGGDIAGVQFDSYFDKQTAFFFMVSAAGVKNDGFSVNDDNESFDGTWDPIWEVKTKIHTEGWNAEIKIPLSQLRFGQKEKQIWGMQVGRNVFRKDEWSVWQHIRNDAAGWASLYGELHGIDNIKPKKQIEIAPFIVTDAQFYEKEEGNPFADGQDFGVNVGIDGKIGITNDFTLDFAINPDFGQVEADPSEVNLTTFESFFAEKRPFFIEGKNITNFQLTPGDSPWAGDNLFYSRRLGRRPRGNPSLADNEYIKSPINTRILGALKLTGKTQKGWSVGVIETVAKREYATIDNNGEQRQESIEPLTNYFIARVQKDINKGNAVIGGMLTSTYRDIDNPDLLFLPKSAITGGVNYVQYFKNRTYFLSSQIAFSQVSGDKKAMLNLQEAPHRYFQRPDADYLTLSPNLTQLSGTGGTVIGGRITNSGFQFLGNITWRSPGIELNDTGFLRQANSLFQFLWAGYKINKSFSVFRSMDFNTTQWNGWDFGAVYLFHGGAFNFNTQFTNFWSVGLSAFREGQGVSNSILRGGPSIVETGRTEATIYVSSNSRKKLQLNANISIGKGDDGSSRLQRINLKVNYQPINSLSISLESSFNKQKNILQYIDQAAYGDETRYIFGSITQKTFNLTLNVNYSITPDLSIQYYGSPFVSGGLYDEFKRITNPHAEQLGDRYLPFATNQIHYNSTNEAYDITESFIGVTSYSFDRPDFNFRQFRSNLVVRWEYSPGSTLFLVWSQGKTNFVADGKFDLNNDLKSLSKKKGRNVFLMKFSYRFRAEQWRKK